MTAIPDRYEPRSAEERWARTWDEEGLYRFDPSRGRDQTFVVDTPPPTVSGSLHIGHCFSYTHQDLIVRYQRMRGRNIHYGMGWDDNGLPTERRVQNLYAIRCDPGLPYDPDFRPAPAARGAAPRAVSRRNFIDACAAATEEDEKAFEHLWRRLGLSIDWSETYATIDEHCRRLSQLSFLDLAAQGRVYSAWSPTLWDVDFRTAVAQAEVEDRERPGLMHELRFAVSGGGELTIATTRPELLPAILAVVAHPDDERYQGLFGKTAITPLFGMEVPILAAEHADPQKGTGILMVCTFGDSADVDWWKRSGLPLRQVLGLDGRMLPITFGQEPFPSRDPARAQKAYDQLSGLSAAQAKKRVAELLAEDSSGPDGRGRALRGEPQPVTQPVKFYEKGERPLELVPTRQWYVRLLDQKEALLEQGRRIDWHPPFMRARFEHWVEGLSQDWCVSRQRYFGVPFPLWYPLDGDGEPDHDHPILAEPGSLPVDPLSHVPPGYRAEQRDRPHGFAAEPDVMDTWATSSLTPQIQSRWRLEPERHRRLFPMDIRPQSHEIIRTWAFYTVVKAWLHDGQVPWRHVVISGWILDPDRKKMSKSHGNVVTPEAVLDQHSVDAVRYWAGRARLGADTAYDEKVFKVGKRLATKVFNASRFVFLQLDRVHPDGRYPDLDHVTHPLDLGLLGRLGEVVGRATEAFEQFDYAGALQVTEEAFWGFCDHYLELVKARSYAEEDTPGRRSALATLAHALSTFLRLLAPFLPYVTEEVWSWRLRGDGRRRSIHTAPWPGPDEGRSLPAMVGASYDAAVEVLGKIRAAKSEAHRTLKWQVEALEVAGAERDLDALRAVLDDVLPTGLVRPEGVRLEVGRPPEGERFTVTVRLAAAEAEG